MIFITEDGIKISFNFEQPLKALEPIEVTDEEINNSVRLKQSQKAWLPIDITELGIIILFNEIQSVNV